MPGGTRGSLLEALQVSGSAYGSAALRCGRLLARLRLTDACGRPLCARVRPPLVEWSAPARWPDPVA
ncbi:DUF5990 family protein [Streptomyces sp. NBC_00069]|uniref:DUF5990 family protein n=1 Tax=Streptomyces sp. NBC_00069 TaxID=2975639 RepID=UPI00386DB24B